jgi:diguanylate cyclase (GGDEF)-like protein/PAS domain S-box-containing protein
VPDGDAADPLRELAGALEHFPSLFALSYDAISLYDRDGTIVVGNDAARAMIGAELSGSHFSRHMERSELPHAEAQFKIALSGKPVEFESVFTGHDGESINIIARLVPALVDGTVVGVFGTARDITALRRAEASRDESRQEFQSLFDQHPDSISMVDTNGRYERMNAAGERLTGYRSDEVFGKKAGSIVAPDDQEGFERFVQGVLAAGTPTRYEREYVRKDGSRGESEGTAVPIVVKESVTGLFFMSRDITERRRIATALALQARRTHALYRLASEIGADADEQAANALAFGLKELDFESAFVVTAVGDGISIERSAGIKVPLDAGDPLFLQLFRETISGSGLLEVDEAALQRRTAAAGGAPAFWRSFLGVPLDLETGRYGALGFASRSATAPLTDFDREFVRAVGKLAAVSIERATEDKRLQGLANFDALTALPNRLLLSDRFKQAIATAQRRGEHLAVYFIDVDKFKAINDTHGHHAGDEVLRTVARRLIAACRASDTVARLGGDEFVVLRTGSPKAKPEALAARLRTHLATPFDIEGLQLKVSVGIGISVFPQDGKDERTLLESADSALYAAKACGAGSIRRFGVEAWAGALSAAGLDRRPWPVAPAVARSA